MSSKHCIKIKKRPKCSNLLRKRKPIRRWLKTTLRPRMNSSRKTMRLEEKLALPKKSNKLRRVLKISLKRMRAYSNKSSTLLWKRMRKSWSNNKRNKWLNKNLKWKSITTRRSKKRRSTWTQLFTPKSVTSKRSNSTPRRNLSSNNLLRKIRNSSNKQNSKLRANTNKCSSKRKLRSRANTIRCIKRTSSCTTNRSLPIWQNRWTRSWPRNWHRRINRIKLL